MASLAYGNGIPLARALRRSESTAHGPKGGAVQALAFRLDPNSNLIGITASRSRRHLLPPAERPLPQDAPALAHGDLGHAAREGQGIHGAEPVGHSATGRGTTRTPPVERPYGEGAVRTCTVRLGLFSGLSGPVDPAVEGRAAPGKAQALDTFAQVLAQHHYNKFRFLS
jgi:hypothetical protein